MAKQPGRLARVYAAGYNLSGSTSQVAATRSLQLDDTTVLTDTSREFLLGLETGDLQQTAFFDDSPGTAYDAVQALYQSGALVPLVYFPMGDATVGYPGWGSGVGEMIDGHVSSPVAGAGILSAKWQPNAGWEMVQTQLASVPVAGTGALAHGPVLDGLAASANGGAVYFHILGLDAGGAVTGYILEDSADNVTFATIATSTLGAAVGGERQVIAGTIRRYTRASYTLTNGKNGTLAVALRRF